MPQSLSLVLVHLVFSTKNRAGLIRPEIEPELHSFLSAVARERGCVCVAQGGTNDHVHILCSLSRTVTIADLVEELKTRSSKWLKTKGPAFARFYWQAGYGAFSIGKSQQGALQAYIAKQKAHHRRTTFQDEFRTLLTKYGIQYDERYVWE